MTLQRFTQCVKTTICLASALFLTGCTQWFFYPLKGHIRTPAAIDMRYEDIWLTTSDGVRLHAWWLIPEVTPVGTLVFFHGNAENISTHFASVIGLVNSGYAVLAVDYRGYGLSEGSPSVDGAIEDIRTAIASLPEACAQSSSTAVDGPSCTRRPVVVFGQSLGSSLSIAALARHPELWPTIDGLILEAGFSRFGTIGREVAAKSPLTWPLQYPVQWLLPSHYDAVDAIRTLPIPALIIHSEDDQIIPFHHGQTLFDAANEPKVFVVARGPHIQAIAQKDVQEQVESFLSQTVPHQQR